MTLSETQTIAEAIRAAEDGLDPSDCLTATEALARVLWLLRTNEAVSVGYEADVGILALTEWSHSEKRSRACQAYRRHLEAENLIAAWA